MAGVTHPASFFGLTPQSQSQFQMQHHLRHVAYDKAASLLGVSLPGLDLTGEITSDWHLRHSARHRTYRLLIGASGTAGRAGLAGLDWEDLSAVRSWIHAHAQLHSALDQYFGLRS
jgi:hypothetical protein